MRQAATRVLRTLRTEGDSPGQQAAAFGLGAFIGCTPLFGLHFPMCMAVGWLLGLNRLKLYVAANVSNPFTAPLLLFTEVQAGHWLRAGRPYPITLAAFRALDLWQFGADLLAGSLVVGVLLGAAAATGTYALVRRSNLPPAVAHLFQAAVDRYAPSGVFAWEFANGKLRNDPVYREVLRLGLLPREGTLVDLGCGQGLMLALLVAAREQGREGGWPAGWAPAPVGLALYGLELRHRAAASARTALGAGAGGGASGVRIDEGDVRSAAIPPAAAILLFDVLHMLPFMDQEAVLRRVVGALIPGGVVIIREADAAGGWRFRVVQVANRLKGVFEGDLRRALCFRTTTEWVALLERVGLAARVHTLPRAASLANVLLSGRRQHDGAARPLDGPSDGAR